MKLRNKKTGEIVEYESFGFRMGLSNGWNDFIPKANSLAELNAEWEDYKPQEEIGRQLVSSPYDKDFYWADEEQQEAFIEFCREEDKRPENQKIPSDLYGDDARFNGVLSGNDRPRNMSEFNAWRNGDDFLYLREVNEQLGRKRWKRFVERNGLEKFSKSKEPLIRDKNERKAVRVWAYVNSIKEVIYAERPDRSLCNILDMGYDTSISFVGWIPTLKDGETYTITELCGEEE